MNRTTDLEVLLNSIESIWCAHRVRLVDSQFVKDSCPVDSREGSETVKGGRSCVNEVALCRDGRELEGSTFLLPGTVVVSSCQTSQPELGSAALVLGERWTTERSWVARRAGKVWLAGKKLEAERKPEPVPRPRHEWEAWMAGNGRGL